MDLTEIRKIMKLMDEHGLSQFQYEKEDFNLKLKKGTDLEELQKLMASIPTGSGQIAAPAPAIAAAAPAAPASDGGAAEAPSGEAISSPMVGTFYRKPSPDDPNFVNVGDTISEGQTLCIIEAMKVMNEIQSDFSGEIVETLIEDGVSVEFGQPLFKIRPA